MPSALEFIASAMKSCGAIGEGETPTSEAAADGLIRLNDMLDSWGTQRLTIYTVARTVKPLTSGTASYTLGTGGDIAIVRPLWIEAAGVILDTGASPLTEVPIRLLTDQEWEQTAQKLFQSTLPVGVYYDHTWTAGLGRVYLWPVPSVDTTSLVLYTPTALTQFADLSTVYTFPPGYRNAIRRNLVLELAEEFGRAVTGVQLEQAQQTLGQIKRSNTRPSELGFDRGLSPRAGSMSRARFESGTF
ncbi:MAG TPA: hypothetical protein VNJ04_12045 [Gemmatimonadaceae bacterium]|nr:hypothetical protein [Gemmatimonadaceae bacterium]